jgi:hypothetical protein
MENGMDIDNLLSNEFHNFIVPIKIWHDQSFWGEKVDYGQIRDLQKKFEERLEWINIIADTGEIKFNEYYTKEYIRKMAEDFKKLDLQQMEDVIRAYRWYYGLKTPKKSILFGK